MSVYELVVLGTASQAPTRDRAHHGALLRFGEHGIILDPGEGTQRQLSLAGLSTACLTHICISHAHGDHCLGLPGVLQRMALEGATQPVDIHFPEHAAPYVERLQLASVYDEDRVDARLRPATPGVVVDDAGLMVRAVALSHSVPTLGWRFDEPEGVTMLPDRLEAFGIQGPDRAELRHHGSIRRGGRTIHLDEVSIPRPPRSVALVMDTRRCDGALELAEGIDLLLIEATFLEPERELAEVAGHLTAAEAVRIGVEAGARRIVLTHYSGRYRDLDGHRAEAQLAAPHADVIVASDLDRVALPPRRAPGQGPAAG